MIMALYAVHRPHSLFSLSTRQKTGVDIDLMKRILRIGLPSGLEQLVLRTGQIEFARTVAGLGTTVFAAHQIALNVVSLSFAPNQAFGMAATTLVGQSLALTGLILPKSFPNTSVRYDSRIIPLCFFLANKSPVSIPTMQK